MCLTSFARGEGNNRQSAKTDFIINYYSIK